MIRYDIDRFLTNESFLGCKTGSKDGKDGKEGKDDGIFSPLLFDVFEDFDYKD